MFYETKLTNTNDLIIKLEHGIKTGDIARKEIFTKFNSWGFVILEFKSCEHPRQALLSLQKLFGSTIYHDHSDIDGIVPVTPIPNKPEYINTTNQDQPLHTDGAFEVEPPKIVALQCEFAAAQGGYSRLLRGEVLYKYLAEKNPESLLALFEADAFSIIRSQKKLTRPIFGYKNNRLNLAFRFDKTVTTSVNPKAQEAFKLAVDFIINPQNQMIFKLKENQIIVQDNTRVMHGRTAFIGNRKMNRLWLNGYSTCNDEFKLGFFPCSEAGKKVFELAKNKLQII